LIVLAASLFTLAHVLGWSKRHDKAYRKLDSQERASVAFLKELQHEAGEIPASGSLLLPEGASAPGNTKPNGGRAATLPIIALLAIALSSAACSNAISPNPATTPLVSAEASTAAPTQTQGADLHVMIDWSGSCVRGAMEECWSVVHSELPSIAERHHIRKLTIWSFDTDGWCPMRLRELPFPELSLPTRATLPPNEWDSFANIQEAIRDAENQEWMNRKKLAEDGYHRALGEAFKPLESVSVLPAHNYETKQSDIVGLLKRISQTREPRAQFVIVLTDLADTQHKEMPRLPAPEGEVHVLLLLLPAQPKDALITIGKPLSGPEQFELRSRQVQQSVPWAVAAPYFAKNLSGLFKSVRE
jgi:hypothetical protein